MTHQSAIRYVSAIIAAASLGIVAPAASAKPIDSGPVASFVAPSPTYALADTPGAASHATGGGGSDFQLIVAGSVGASLALLGFGGTIVTSRRRRRRRAAGAPTVAA